MLRLRHLALCASASLLFAVTAASQNPTNVEVSLSATQTYLVVAPPNIPSTLVPFQVDVGGRKDEMFDVITANAGAVVSLILPDGTEVNSSNAASLGFGYIVIAEDSEAVTDKLLITFLTLTGTHTVIELPPTAPAGTYQAKINTIGIPTETELCLSYMSTSPLRVALTTKGSSYHVGDSVVLSAMVFNGTSPVTNATVEASIIDQEHPETTPVPVTMQDSGTNDAATGDGIYTGVYPNTAVGKFLAGIRVTGTLPSGAAYTRTSGTEFRVLPQLAGFISFSDVGVDDNDNDLIDRVVITAGAQVQTAGNYRLELSLAASNGSEDRAINTANLLTGVQQIATSFSARQLSRLGVDGPYMIKNARLVFTDDPEQAVAAFSAVAGQTAAYALSSLERSALKFTGNNSVTGIDTNGNGKFDLLRIQVEVNAIIAGTYNWSGTLKDAAGKDIQAIDCASSMSAGNNVLTFNFDGIKVAQNGVDGPYALSSGGNL